MEENIAYVQGIELLAVLGVSTLQQLLIELGASYYPSHQMGSCHVRVGIRKIEGLTPAWCNFVNPFSYNVEFSHRSHRFSQIFDSFGVFAVSLSESTCCLQQDYLCKSVRSVGD